MTAVSCVPDRFTVTPPSGVPPSDTPGVRPKFAPDTNNVVPDADTSALMMTSLGSPLALTPTHRPTIASAHTPLCRMRIGLLLTTAVDGGACEGGEMKL